MLREHQYCMAVYWLWIDQLRVAIHRVSTNREPEYVSLINKPCRLARSLTKLFIAILFFTFNHCWSQHLWLGTHLHYVNIWQKKSVINLILQVWTIISSTKFCQALPNFKTTAILPQEFFFNCQLIFRKASIKLFCCKEKVLIVLCDSRYFVVSK